MKKNARKQGDTRVDATAVGQGISIKFDHHSDTMWTVCTPNKKPPIAWFNKLLTKFEYKGECFASLDPGGKLGKHHEVKLLLEKHGYNLRPRAPYMSHQNTPG
eukprot:15350464-Ditylum_brightwellii.AAC.1